MSEPLLCYGLQFGPHGAIEPCGRKLMFRGTGSGSGGNPISKEWQKGQVTNLCPEWVIFPPFFQAFLVFASASASALDFLICTLCNCFCGFPPAP